MSSYSPANPLFIMHTTTQTSFPSFQRWTVALVLMVGLLMTGLPNVQAQSIYVDANATGADDGSSWENAYTDLQDALANATGSDEIWVAQGVYVPGASEDDSFTITGDEDGIELYGGFTGSETDRSQRDVEANVTVLSGNIDGDDDTNADGVTESFEDIVGNNSHNVVILDGTTGSAITSSTVIDGFTITGGQADGSDQAETNGAGILCDGGGVVNTGSSGECSPQLQNIQFVGNEVTQTGSGVLFLGAQTSTSEASPALADVAFLRNEGGGGILSTSGASGTVTPTLHRVQFIENEVVAGTIRTGMRSDGNASFEIVDAEFIDNSTRSDLAGAGILNEAENNARAEVKVVNSTFLNHSFNGDGLIRNNVRDADAEVTLTIRNSTFAGTEGGFGGEGTVISNEKENPDGTADIDIANSIFWDNQANILNEGTLTVSHSIVEGSGGSGDWDDDFGTDGGNNLDVDPLLVDVNANNARLNWASPAIFAGDAGVLPSAIDEDLDGNERVRGPEVDMGAYEGGAFPSTDEPLHVNAGFVVDDGQSGEDWSFPYGTLEGALRAVRNEALSTGSRSFDEVWISQGVYVPGDSEDDSFTITGDEDGVALYGGFGGFETNRDERDPQTNLTVLSGDINGDDDTNFAGVVEHADDINGNNAHHVLTLNAGNSIGNDVDANITRNTVIDGLTITAGQATGSNVDQRGGGLICDGTGTDNTCNPTLENVVFQGNIASDRGGALYQVATDGGESNPDLMNVVFSGNLAENGGALYADGTDGGTSSPTIANSVFANNTARAADEDDNALGGAMVFNGDDGESSPHIVNTTFVSNVGDFGGALYHRASGGTSTPLFINTILYANEALDTGSQVRSWTDGAQPRFAFTLLDEGADGVATGGGADASFLDENDDAVDFDQSTNLDENPLFVDQFDPAGDDAIFATDDDGLRLGDSSPALNTGSNDAADNLSTDILGEDRIQGGTVSLGAYEAPGGEPGYTGPIYYVTEDGDASNEGDSWTNALPLTEAIERAGNDDVIVIAEGVYTPVVPDDPANVTEEERAQWFEINGNQDGLQIYGGWTGTESFGSVDDIQDALPDRDLQAHRTVLSGDIDNNDATNDDGITETVDDINGDNSYTVMYLNASDGTDGLSRNTVIDGLVVTGGNTDGDREDFEREGAGMICYSTSNSRPCSPQLSNLTITGNHSEDHAGGLMIRARGGVADPLVANVVFVNNQAERRGGGAYVISTGPGSSPSGFARPTIANSLFYNNKAEDGGGMDGISLFSGGFYGGKVINTLFVDNIATDGTSGGGYRAGAGGGGTHESKLINSFFKGNISGGEVEGLREISTDEVLVSHSFFERGEEEISDDGGIEYLDEDGNAASFEASTNLEGDPLLAWPDSPAGLDEVFATENDGLRPTEQSPLLNAGTNEPFEPNGAAEDVATDLIGEDRIQEGTVSIGPYESASAIARTFTLTGTSGTGNDTGWRVMGTPYSDVEAGDLRLDHADGTSTPRFSDGVLQLWDDSAGDIISGDYVAAEASSTLPDGEGFLFFVADDAEVPVDPDLTFRLTSNTTASLQQTEPVTVEDLAETAQWHLLANPYPSTYALIGLESEGASLQDAGFNVTAQVYDATSEAWQFVDVEQEAIAPWQGFFIERTDIGEGPTAVTFEPEAGADDVPFIGAEAKTTASASVQDARLDLKAVATSASDEELARDEAIALRFHESATSEWDAYDASKMDPLSDPYVQLSALGTGRDGDSVPKAIESQPYLQDEDGPVTIPLQVDHEGLGSEGDLSDIELTLSIADWDLPTEWAAELIDTQGTASEHDNEHIPLDEHTQYTIGLDELTEGGDDDTERLRIQIAASQEALPVELAEFEAQLTGDESVQLQWETISETDNAGFEIQRREASVETSRRDVSTGESWQTIANVDGAGTTDEPQSYRFDDTDLPYAADSLTYRLRQIDTDGTESFSDEVVVERQPTEAELLPTYPNPTSSQATVRFAVPESQHVRIHLYDMLGRRVQTVTDQELEGRHEQAIDVSRLASGTYFLRMQTDDGPVDTQRITVVR